MEHPRETPCHFNIIMPPSHSSLSYVYNLNFLWSIFDAFHSMSDFGLYIESQTLDEWEVHLTLTQILSWQRGLWHTNMADTSAVNSPVNYTTLTPPSLLSVLYPNTTFDLTPFRGHCTTCDLKDSAQGVAHGHILALLLLVYGDLGAHSYSEQHNTW